MDSKGNLYYVDNNRQQDDMGIPVISEEKAEELGLIPVIRDLTFQEKLEGKIRRYSPCGCGSGKKFKFCCGGK